MASAQLRPVNMLKGVCVLKTMVAHAALPYPLFFDLVSLPVMFIFAGSLFKSGVSLKDFAHKKLYRIVIPLAVFFVINFVYVREQCSGIGLVHSVLRVGYHAFVPMGTNLWFIQLIVYMLLGWWTIDYFTSGRSQWIKAGVVLLIVALIPLLPVEANVMFYRLVWAFPLLAIGGTLFSLENLRRFHDSSIWIKVACMTLSGAICALVIWHDGSALMDTERPYVAILSGSAGFVCTFSICSIVTQFEPLEWFGRNALLMFMAHGPFYKLAQQFWETTPLQSFFFGLAGCVALVIVVKRWAPVLGGYYVPASLRKQVREPEMLNLEAAP